MSLASRRGGMIEFVMPTCAQPSGKVMAGRRTSRAGHGNRRNDHKGVGHGAFVGDREVDARLVARRRDRLEAALGAAGQSSVGRPDGRLTTPMSRHHTPARNPVPSALAQASLAAKRLA